MTRVIAPFALPAAGAPSARAHAAAAGRGDRPRRGRGRALDGHGLPRIALWLAALAPVLLLVSVLDGGRVARASSRRERAGRRASHAAAAADIDRWHDEDTLAFAYAPPGCRGPSCGLARRCGGGAPPPTTSSSARERSSGPPVTGGDGVIPTLSGCAPVPACWRTRRSGSRDGGHRRRRAPGLARAVVRALVLQLCLALPPGELRVQAGGEHPWVARLPHTRRPVVCSSGVGEPGRALRRTSTSSSRGWLRARPRHPAAGRC